MYSCPQAFACTYELEDAYAKELLQLDRAANAAKANAANDAAADGTAW